MGHTFSATDHGVHDTIRNGSKIQPANLNPMSTVSDDHMQLHNDIHSKQQYIIQSCSSSSRIVYLKEGTGSCSVLSLLNTLPSILILMQCICLWACSSLCFLALAHTNTQACCHLVRSSLGTLRPSSLHVHSTGAKGQTLLLSSVMMFPASMVGTEHAAQITTKSQHE